MTLSRRGFLRNTLIASGALAAPTFAHAAPSARAGLNISGAGEASLPSALTAQIHKALERHSRDIVHRDRVGLSDFSRSSGEFRFHIVNAQSGRVMKSLLVAHGKGSDPRNSGFARRFSNRSGSHASSLGSYLTGQSYIGRHGQSRRLHGLEPANNRAYSRAIVIHGARYVDHAMAEQRGRVGRSLGCFAFEYNEIDFVLNSLGAGRLLLAAS